jgi:hypothetical protein
MPKVYVPQMPSRYDAATKLWVPSINIDPAKPYGEVVVMLPPNANRLHISPLIVALREQMRDYGPEDWVVAVGDPSLIAAAACIATKKTGGILRVLKWDRQTSQYLAVETQI